MGTTYEQDVVAWANEQAALLRAGRLDALDLQHIAEEIEDVGKSEQRELASRMAVLLAHLLKWQHQPERRGTSWQRTIKEQRTAIKARLKRTPSLKPMMSDPDWQEEIWADAVTKAIDETGLNDFPAACAWSVESVLSVEFYPA
jgi:hypothetical protein